MRNTRGISPSHIAISLISVLLLTAYAGAQDVTGPALKAAFIYNFAKFTEWPEDAVQAKHFVMCVLGDDAVSDALERGVKDRFIAGNSINVVRLTSTVSHRPCHLVYVSGVTSEQAAQVVAGLRGAPVLTISDLDAFTELGGIAQFFFEHGQLRFSIGLDAAKNARLQISAKVLTLAIRK